MAAEEENKQQIPFEIKKIYLKDASLESPSSPDVFTRPFQPQINVEFDNTSTKKVRITFMRL